MKNFYAIQDLKAASYSPPYLADSHAVAQRMLIQTLTSPQMERSNLRQFPEDFSLFCIGSFDDSTGVIVSMPNGHVHICDVSTIVATLISTPADVQPHI